MSEAEYMEYYRETLGLAEDDFEKLSASTRTGLPYSFRVTKGPMHDRIVQRIEQYPFVNKIQYLNDVYEFCKTKDPSSDYQRFVEFLVKQTAIGLIQRQEIVSMIPVMLMDLKNDSKVIDMCAAPGSKAKQALEIVTDGLVIANDVNAKRLNVLVSETSKKPNRSLIVTKHDASVFPKVYMDGQVEFDRVFCDVVCSSDGTIRKNPNVFDEWKISRGVGLSELQYRILKRGCELAKEAGLVAYSTCSLNPIENECVVQRILLEGEFELVDFRNDTRLCLFPMESDGKQLVFRQGLRTWKTAGVSNNPRHRPCEEDLGLERCIRLYPHDQNTGGFFIAILRRKMRSQASHPEECTSKQKCMQPKHCRIEFMAKDDKDKLFREYSISMEGELYKRGERSLSIVSCLASKIIMSNPKLKVVSAGYRILEKSGLDRCEFYLKNLFYVGHEFVNCREIHLDCFRLLLNDVFVSNDTLGFECVGISVIRVQEIGIVLCGYGNTMSFTLFMNDNLRKALKELVS